MPTSLLLGSTVAASVEERNLNPSKQLLCKRLMKTHAIHWKSSVNGTFATGTKRFEKEEAERLATALNEEYPGIDHKAVIPVPIAGEPADAELGPPLHC